MINRIAITTLHGFAILAAFIVGVTFAFAANETEILSDGKSPRPNILLIIGDDIGLDVTTLISNTGPQGIIIPTIE